MEPYETQTLLRQSQSAYLTNCPRCGAVTDLTGSGARCLLCGWYENMVRPVRPVSARLVGHQKRKLSPKAKVWAVVIALVWTIFGMFQNHSANDRFWTPPTTTYVQVPSR